MKVHKHILLVAILLIFVGGSITCCSENNHQSSERQSSQVTADSHTKKSVKTDPHRHSQSPSTVQPHQTILKKLIDYTNNESAGPTGDYY